MPCSSSSSSKAFGGRWFPLYAAAAVAAGDVFNEERTLRGLLRVRQAGAGEGDIGPSPVNPADSVSSG